MSTDNVRCGKDTVHDPHDWWKGHCDGGLLDPATPMTPAVPIRALYTDVTAHPRPWAWGSLLSVEQARQLVDQLDVFAGFYNATYVLKQDHLVLGCWPLHPGLAQVLAALYGTWVSAHCSGISSGQLSLTWHTKDLPAFRDSVRDWFGLGVERCQPGEHRGDWNPVAGQLTEAAYRAPEAVTDDVLRGLIDNAAHLDGT